MPEYRQVPVSLSVAQKELLSARLANWGAGHVSAAIASVAARASCRPIAAPRPRSSGRCRPGAPKFGTSGE